MMIGCRINLSYLYRNNPEKMKKYYMLIAAILFFREAIGQEATGRVVSFFLEAKTLQNAGGESPNRKVSVYLPPDYNQPGKRFPVIYYLHGFMGTDSIYANM